MGLTAVFHFTDEDIPKAERFPPRFNFFLLRVSLASSPINRAAALKIHDYHKCKLRSILKASSHELRVIIFVL